MKKMIQLATIFCFLGISLNALPVLNLADPALLREGVFRCDNCDWMGFKFGYRGDFVFNRHYHVNGTQINPFSLFANEGVMTLNFWDRLDIYGFLGAARFNTEGSPQDPNLGTQFDSFVTQSSTHTIGGLGVKAVIWDICWLRNGITYVGIDAQYQWMGNTYFKRASIQGVNVATNGTGRSYKEGQIALGVTHKVHEFAPYMAVTWSNSRANASGQVGSQGSITPGTVLDLGKYKANHQWGYAFGTSVIFAKKAMITAEVRLINQTAMTIAADFRF